MDSATCVQNDEGGGEACTDEGFRLSEGAQPYMVAARAELVVVSFCNS